MEIVTAYDPGFDPPSAAEAISAAKASGGLAVLAHPLQLMAVNLSKLIEELVGVGLAGIEGSYPYSREEDIRRADEIEALATDYHLFMTGGSDAHRPEEIGRCKVELPGAIKERCLGS